MKKILVNILSASYQYFQRSGNKNKNKASNNKKVTRHRLRILFHGNPSPASERALHALEHAGGRIQRIDLGELRETASFSPQAGHILPVFLRHEEGTTSLLREMNASGRAPMPLIVIDDSGGPAQSVRLLDAGADDVLRSPFDAAEIMARIRAIGRRIMGKSETSVQVFDLTIPLDGGALLMSGQEFHLSARERDILGLLAASHPRRVSKQVIYDGIYGLACNPPHLKVIDSHMHNLRRKLTAADPQGRDFIDTAIGIGYRLAGGN